MSSSSTLRRSSTNRPRERPSAASTRASASASRSPTRLASRHRSNPDRGRRRCSTTASSIRTEVVAVQPASAPTAALPASQAPEGPLGEHELPQLGRRHPSGQQRRDAERRPAALVVATTAQPEVERLRHLGDLRLGRERRRDDADRHRPVVPVFQPGEVVQRPHSRPPTGSYEGGGEFAGRRLDLSGRLGQRGGGGGPGHERRRASNGGRRRRAAAGRPATAGTWMARRCGASARRARSRSSQSGVHRSRVRRAGRRSAGRESAAASHPTRRGATPRGTSRAPSRAAAAGRWRRGGGSDPAAHRERTRLARRRHPRRPR